MLDQHNWKDDDRFFTFEERLKKRLIPPRLYLRNLAWRRLKRGEKELPLLGLLVDPGRVSLDIGANKGVYSWFLSKLSREVHAFEPNPKILELLKPALPANCRAHEVALSDQNGEAELILPLFRAGGFSNQGATLQPKKLDGQAFETIPVRQRTLDSYGLTDVAFIKIDVEGFELEVLRGARETLAREKPVLLIEIDPGQNKRPLEETIAKVCDYGYACFYVSQSNLRPFAGFHQDTRKTPTNNFIFFGV